MNLTNISRPYLGINKMKIDLTTGTWQDNPGCPINITLVSTSDGTDLQVEVQIRILLKDKYEIMSKMRTPAITL